MLNINGISVFYEGLCALKDVHIKLDSGEFIAVVGPNGAGKTTLFKAISGVVPITAGQISYNGQDLSKLQAHERASLGIAHVPEGRQVFPSLSVLENLLTGAQSKKARESWPQTLAFIHTLFPRLAERSEQAAGTLSGGEQQMVAIGRGLASMPQLLMLDEPSMGLAPAVADQIFECIQRIHKEQGISVLLVEQRVGEALESCDRGYVLESGHLAMSGTHQELMQDSRIKKSYLGL
ncbi:MAG: ABC transporter ATP-binding protein [Burkholderiaceae bacterium]